MNRLMGKKVAIDSMILIYLLDEHPRYWEKIAKALDNAEKIIISSLLYAEVLSGLYFEKAEKLRQFEYFIQENRQTVIQNFDLSSATIFAELRNKYSRIKSPACIHLSCALTAQADFFVTNDKRIEQIAGIKIIQLEKL